MNIIKSDKTSTSVIVSTDQNGKVTRKEVELPLTEKE